MNDFVQCNKISGVYWLRSPVESLKIKVQLKPPDDILSLPKFEDYTKEADSINIKPNIEEHTFKWQEKSFSAREIHNYSEIHNCVTETEIKYHEMIKNNEIAPNKVSTYIHDDYHLPLPEIKKKKVNTLDLILGYLNLSDAVGSIGRAFGGRSDSMRHLLKSRDSLCEEEKWTAMHVVLDHSEDKEDLQHNKHESTLLSIFHNRTHNYVMLSPDVNDLESNPYTVDGLSFKYAVSVDFGQMGGSEDLETLLSRLNAKWEKKHKNLVKFLMPPLGRIQYFICIDLMTAEQFDMDLLYIEYTIKLPEGLRCEEPLHGRTHTSASITEDGRDVWKYGHLIQLTLDTDANTDLPPLKLYLEAISIDWRCRHRTEGYCYLPITLTPGLRSEELSCLRPEEQSWRGEERRFFVGGCNLIEDLDLLSKTDAQNANFIYTTTGKIHLRYSILSQRGSLTSVGGSVTPIYEHGSSVLEDAEAALNKYRKARARLAAATRDIHVGSGDG